MKKKIIWWECHLTDHQFYTIKELAEKFEITLISEKTNNKDRIIQGWKNSNYNFDSIVYFDKYLNGLLTILRNKNCPIIFAGPFESWKSILVLMISIFKKNEIYILSEPFSDTNEGMFNDNINFKTILKNKFRFYIYKLYALFLFSRIKAFFVISKKAYHQYLSLNVPEFKLFPYCYFIPNNYIPIANDIQVNKENLRLLFLGTLSYRKGIDLLIEAVCELNASNYQLTLDIYGSGDFSKFDKNNDKIKYKGIVPFGEAPKYMSNYDILVLPSRFDGWGVVVNEAIIARIPVLCSSNVGASDMIKLYECGLIFEKLTVNGIKSSLIKIIENKDLFSIWRNNLKILNKNITTKEGADFIFNVINNFKVDKKKWYEV